MSARKNLPKLFTFYIRCVILTAVFSHRKEATAWIFVLQNDGAHQDIAEIKELLKAYNESRCPDVPEVPLGVFYEDAHGKKLAGITGSSCGQWLCLNFFFVSDSLRGQGIGSKILTAAENEGRKRGCKYAFLYTWSFQAPEFYKKMGYTCKLQLPDFPVWGTRYYMMKEL